MLFLEAVVNPTINTYFITTRLNCVLSWNHVIREHFCEVMLRFLRLCLYSSLISGSVFFLLEHMTSLFYSMCVFLESFPSAPLTNLPYSSLTRHFKTLHAFESVMLAGDVSLCLKLSAAWFCFCFTFLLSILFFQTASDVVLLVP